MDYENKYKYALERAKEIVNDQNASSVWKGWLYNCFPELQDSEDERIRKSLITYFQRFPYDSIESAGTNAKEAISWLEKQGGIDNCPLEYSTNTVMTDSRKNKVKPKFKVGDIIIKSQNSDINKFGKFKITGIKDGRYWYNEFVICEISEQDEWELVKVEPKDYFDIPFGAKDSELQEASYHIPEGFYIEIKGNKLIIKKNESILL